MTLHRIPVSPLVRSVAVKTCVPIGRSGSWIATGIFLYSVKIVCGKQTETNCCCVAGVRPGVYATEVNIHNLNPGPAFAVKAVQPLINSGAVVAREPNVFDPATLPKHAIETVQLPPLGVT